MITSLPELKAFLKFEPGNPQDETIIAAIGQAANDAITRYLGYSVKYGMYVEDYPLIRNVYLRHAPVEVISTIMDYQGNNISPVRVYREQGILAFRETGGEIEVSYTAGYGKDVPGDLKWATYLYAETLWSQKGKHLIRQESIGSYSYSTAEPVGITIQMKELLMPYRRVRL